MASVLVLPKKRLSMFWIHCFFPAEVWVPSTGFSAELYCTSSYCFLVNPITILVLYFSFILRVQFSYSSDFAFLFLAARSHSESRKFNVASPFFMWSNSNQRADVLRSWWCRLYDLPREKDDLGPPKKCFREFRMKLRMKDRLLLRWWWRSDGFCVFKEHFSRMMFYFISLG